jgi:hypothetical protein
MDHRGHQSAAAQQPVAAAGPLRGPPLTLIVMRHHAHASASARDADSIDDDRASLFYE